MLSRALARVVVGLLQQPRPQRCASHHRDGVRKPGIVMGVIAVLAPGKGAQSPGMLAPWLDLPGAPELVGELSEVAGLDLLRLGTTADADEIKDTAVTQPLIVALGLLAAPHLGLDDASAGASVVAGHSVGELTAASVAGALAPRAAVGFAARRGAAMAAACALVPTGMSALLGGDPDEVVAAIEAAGLTPANRNGAGQIVSAGALSDLAKLAAEPPPGVRVRPLPVAGAFHTSYMAPAEAVLQDYAATLDITDPHHLLLSNADGTAVAEGAALRERLVAQVTLPVRWDLCLRTPDDLDAARRLIRSQPQHGQGEYTPDFQVVVAPAKGVFTPATVAEGTQLRRGTLLGTVRTNREEHSIVAGSAGVLLEWLRREGDIVAAGLPVARLSNGTEAP